MIAEASMLAYLQDRLTDALEDCRIYGPDDRIASKKLNACIACKDMVETLICKPVNLGKDGTVTVGY